MGIIYLIVSLGDLDDQLGLGVLELQEDFINLTQWVSSVKFRKIRREEMENKKEYDENS